MQNIQKQLSKDNLVSHFPTFVWKSVIIIKYCQLAYIIRQSLSTHQKKKKKGLMAFHVKQSTASHWQRFSTCWRQTVTVTLSNERTKCMSFPLARGHAIYKQAAWSSPDRPQRTLIETAICSHSVLGRELYRKFWQGRSLYWEQGNQCSVYEIHLMPRIKSFSKAHTCLSLIPSV